MFSCLNIDLKTLPSKSGSRDRNFTVHRKAAVFSPSSPGSLTNCFFKQQQQQQGRQTVTLIH